LQRSGARHAGPVRRSPAGDVAAIARIYGYAIRESVATFDVTDPPPSYWQDKLSSDEAGDHIIVVEDAATVLG
jgi:L-amino acid N-acyltransferase YncA